MSQFLKIGFVLGAAVAAAAVCGGLLFVRSSSGFGDLQFDML